MAELDTDAEIALIDGMPRSQNPEQWYLQENGRLWLKEINRLQAENQRLEEQHEAMADALVTEGVKLHYAKNEIESVLQLMDGLAEQWGDEAVFRRCRDRLRALTKEVGE